LHSNRVKQRLILSPAELDLLDNAKWLSGAPSRSAFTTQAISIGLRDFNQTIPKTTRKRRINVWIPSEIKTEMKERAKALAVTQQALLRYYILNRAKTKSVQQQNTELPIERPEGSSVG
jgi:hypothetical protein